MRTRNFCLIVGLVAPTLLACGDDKTGINPDAKPVDGIDASTFKGYNADEGGEVRHEYVYTASGAVRVRSTTFLWEPGSIDFFTFANQNGCTDVRKDQTARFWPTAVNPKAERTYLDMGNVVFTGGPTELTVGKHTSATNADWVDPAGRDHPVGKANVHFKPMDPPDGATYISEKTVFDVAFTGGADVPAQTFEDVMYMPAAFAPTNAPVCNPACPVTTLVADTPMTFTWTTPADTPPAGFEVLSLVAFTHPTKGPAIICVEPNDGSITVPAELVNAARAYYTGDAMYTLARQTLTHSVRELKDNSGPTGRRIDFIGIWCYASSAVSAP